MTHVVTPDEITGKGERLYRERFQREYEILYPGKYLVIDVTTEQPYLAETPEAALQNAMAANPKGFFHLVRIGAAGVYRVGYTQRSAIGRHF